jgi:hypothetical protein
MQTKWLGALASRLLPASLRAAGLGLVLAGGAGWARASMNCSCSAPEIDPNALAGALTLLTGGVLVLGGRLRRRPRA